MKFVDSLIHSADSLEKKRSCICLWKPSVSTFQINMASQTAQSKMSELPLPINIPRNNKDEMFNDITTLLNQKKWNWSDDGDTHGRRFVFDLHDALWYTDGYHPRVEQWSCSTPIAI